MAGARVEITLDDAAVLQRLTQAQARLGTAGIAPLLDKLGEYLLGATRDRAASEHGPDGEPWPALSPRYAKRKARKRPHAPLLVWDFHMLGDRLAWQVAGNTLYVGTGAPYGARQQFGGGGIPARPWLGVAPEDSVEIRERTLAYLKEVLDGA